MSALVGDPVCPISRTGNSYTSPRLSRGRGTMPPRRGPPLLIPSGLASLRTHGQATRLLFLDAIASRPYSRLDPLARTLGVTIQAASHVYRQLARQGLVQFVEGVYRPTVAGVAALHDSFSSLRVDIDARLSHLRVIQRCRAVAGATIRPGSPVVLTMENGVLTARPGRGGASRGVAAHPARAGELIDVDRLEGIVPLEPATVLCVVVPTEGFRAARFVRPLKGLLRRRSPRFLGAEGIEAAHLLERSTRRPYTRFGVAAAAHEAAQLGVSSLVVLTDDGLSRFLAHLANERPALPVEIHSLEQKHRPGRAAPPLR